MIINPRTPSADDLALSDCNGLSIWVHTVAELDPRECLVTVFSVYRPRGRREKVDTLVLPIGTVISCKSDIEACWFSIVIHVAVSYYYIPCEP
jgi:hypothetical protein